MASKAVKEKLQRTVLNRQSFKQAETQRETAHISELDSQHEQPNTPPSSQQRRKQLWRAASEFVLKHERRRCSSSRKDPLNNSFPSSSNSPTCQCSPPSDRSDLTSQLWDYSVQPYYQVERNPSFSVPLRMWPPLTVPQQNPLHHSIMLKTVYVDTTMFPRPHLLVHPGVCFSVRLHRPLERCQSQPLIHSHQPRGFDQHHSFRDSARPTHERHPEAEERTAVQDAGKVRFMVGEEVCDECTSSESSCSSHLYPSKWQRRPAMRKHSRSLTHTLSCQPAHFLPDTVDSASDHTQSTGLVYDPLMLMQHCICDPKHAGRIPLVFNRLQECGVSDQCKWFRGRQCNLEVVQVLHQNGANPLSCLQPSVMMAAGCVTELVLLVAQGQLRNGFAIVQPHGHDALHSSPSTSVATFSSVAIATKQLQKKHNRKILILDWDVHHCNITQEMFYTDPNVLHISLHCSTVRGRADEVGLGDGEGFNVNVEWSCDLDPPIGDTEYLAAFRTVIKPIAQQFSPDVILISTEFNTVDGHPASHGGLRVSAKCFGLLTQNLMELSGGHVVVVLEQGHDITAVCEASKACVNALLENQVASLSDDVLMKKPCAAAVQSLHRVLQIHSQYWSSVRDLTHTVGESWLRAERKYSVHTDTASALASLSVTTPKYTGCEVLRFCRGGTEPVEHDEDEDKP
ncbi:histone deacetylase 4 isoform X2 [Ictalurus furcatus]|uniref:histone deacetylase 4 isoform X2 n=1 Tax=Ictalurus furcatus TaxID=66913 RepID=UPI0023504945|nr:histone deacetylase 4 isoform X2 [Ictalurus furcatus]